MREQMTIVVDHGKMVLCQVSLRKSLRDSSHVNEETDQILDHSPTWAFFRHNRRYFKHQKLMCWPKWLHCYSLAEIRFFF